MHFSTAVVAAFAATYASASPLKLRSAACGAAPTGGYGDKQPILQPSGMQTAAACQLQCQADSNCQSFCFGLVSVTVECKLYACAASAIPEQSSANLVTYDKACSAVPSIVPTSSNPTGKHIDNSPIYSESESSSKSTHKKTGESKSSDKSTGQKAEESKFSNKVTGQTTEKSKSSDKATDEKSQESESSDNTTGQKAQESQPAVEKTNGEKSQESMSAADQTIGQKAQQSKSAAGETTVKKAQDSKPVQASNDNVYATQRRASSNTHTESHNDQSVAKTCGVKPSASTNNRPISTPSLVSETACKAQCQANNSCKSFSWGKVDNAPVCKLYAVAAARVPNPTTTAQKNALKVYDVSCSM